MQIITLYKYTRADGGITVSPKKPEFEVECTEMYRLVADEGKALTKDGVETTICTDVESTEGWYEVKVNEEGEIVEEDQATEEDYISALEELGVNFDA
jgi:hypothetical protein